MTAQLNGRWDAVSFFEEAVNEAQTQTAFVCVSDIADGYTELNNTPRTRRVKTVFSLCVTLPKIWRPAPSAWKRCANCSVSSCRGFSPKRSGQSRTASTLTPEQRSTRLTAIFSEEQRAHISKSPLRNKYYFNQFSTSSLKVGEPPEQILIIFPSALTTTLVG